MTRRLAQRRLKVIDLVEEVRTRVVTSEEMNAFGDRHRLLRNVNTPDDYTALLHSPSHQL
jgi:molybdopterin-guanine dinucleotide biosynthesis protein A